MLKNHLQKSVSIRPRTNPDKFAVWLRLISPDLELFLAYCLVQPRSQILAFQSYSAAPAQACESVGFYFHRVETFSIFHFFRARELGSALFGTFILHFSSSTSTQLRRLLGWRVRATEGRLARRLPPVVLLSRWTGTGRRYECMWWSSFLVHFPLLAFLPTKRPRVSRQEAVQSVRVRAQTH